MHNNCGEWKYMADLILKKGGGITMKFNNLNFTSVM